jgi:RecQ family ATP-dependent DNA helicase
MLSRGAFKLVYAAPERFYVRNQSEREQLNSAAPSFLVVDEAHCVDQWGNDFRPEYGRLAEVRESLGRPPMLAFTATAGKEMQQRILTSLGIPDARVFVRDVDRPNIALLRRRCPPDRRTQEIASLLRLPELQGRRVMVFVPSAKVGEDLKADLLKVGLEIPLYHSKLGTPFERQELVKRYLGESKPPINHIICSNAFGMGLDVPDVRLVIHWQQPASVEDLLQEFGRAGRDGRPSVSVVFHEGDGSTKDPGRLRFMADMTVDTAPLDPSGKREMLDMRYRQIAQVEAMLKAEQCFRRSIRSYFGEEVVPTKRSLSERILDWAFGTRAVQQRRAACCDFCDRARLKEGGVKSYVVTVLNGTWHSKR